MPGTRFKVTNMRVMPPTQLELSLDDSKFCAYHEQNPQVYKKFEEFTLKTIEKGFKNYGAKGIFELVRWTSGVSADNDCFKVNNSYTSLYARMFEKKHPQYKDFFRKRKSRFD